MLLDNKRLLFEDTNLRVISYFLHNNGKLIHVVIYIMDEK